MHAYRLGEVWYDEQVAPGQFSAPSLAVDTAGRAHISAFETVNQDLFYAYQTEAGWLGQIVDSQGAVGQGNSLAISAAGHVMISYYDAGNRDLKLAVRRVDPLPTVRRVFLPLLWRQ